jgi:hypothetical protein
MISTNFWDITPYNPLKVNGPSGGTNRLLPLGRRISPAKDNVRLPLAFTLPSCSAYSCTLRMEVICSFETSVYFERATRRYIPEDSTARHHRSENLKSVVPGCSDGS